MEEETTTTTTTTTSTEETQPLLPPGSADSAGCDKKDVQPLLKQYVVNLILAKIKTDRMKGKTEEYIKQDVIDCINMVRCNYDEAVRTTTIFRGPSTGASTPMVGGAFPTNCEELKKKIRGLSGSIMLNVVGKVKTDQMRGVPADITKKQVEATLENIICEYDTIAGTKVLSSSFIRQNIQTGFDTIRNRNAYKADMPPPSAKKSGFFGSWFGSSKGGRSRRGRSGKRGGRKTTKRRGAKRGTRRRR